MRWVEAFFGAILILLGGLFLVTAAGCLIREVLASFWPQPIISPGATMIRGGFRPREPGRFQSADFETVGHRADIIIEAAPSPFRRNRRIHATH
jgi:hypothetical protein